MRLDGQVPQVELVIQVPLALVAQQVPQVLSERVQQVKQVHMVPQDRVVFLVIMARSLIIPSRPISQLRVRFHSPM